MDKIVDDDKIIITIKETFSEINSKLNNNEEKSDYEIEEFFLINKVWLEKYFSIAKKEKIFKELIYFMLSKIPLASKKYLYHSNSNNFLYLNNFQLIPNNILSYFLSIININKNNSESDHNLKKYNLTKVILKSSKIILILEEQLSLEILNKNLTPEYLLCFKENQNISNVQMIQIYIEEMKLKIPDKAQNSIINNIESENGVKITILNLGKIIEEIKDENSKINEDNTKKMNNLWENKYKKKIDSHLDAIINKYNSDFQKKISLNNEIIKEKLKEQNAEQNIIFKNNYNNIINKLNDSRIYNDDENNKNDNKDNNQNKINFIMDNYIKQDSNENKNNNINKEYINENNYNGFLIIDDPKEVNSYNIDSINPLNEDKINLVIVPTLFFLSKINHLIDYLNEKKESIRLYNYVDENSFSHLILEFLENIKDSNCQESIKEIYLNYCNIILNIISSKSKYLLNKFNSPGNLLSYILQTLDEEQNKSYQFFNEQSTIELMNNPNKENDIYNDQEMLKVFIDKSLNQKSFINEKFDIIIKSSKLCKECNKRSYEYNSYPTLNIYLNKTNSLVNENDADYEMYNALICKINFPENISQLISPSSMSKKTEFCKNCNKYNEIIYNKNICILKNYLILNIDRENDPKNDMIFIYPEILDLKKESEFIINLYQLTGVLCKKINEHNYNINEVEKDISHYICYFRKENENKWICFDEDFHINEIENNSSIFNFKGVSALLYSKIENK